MFVAHKYAVMTLGVLVKLPVLDAVVDNFRVNAAAPQICKNAPVVGVFGWEGKFSLEMSRNVQLYRRLNAQIFRNLFLFV